MKKYYNNNLINLLRGFISNNASTGNSNIDALFQKINSILANTEMFDFSNASLDYRDLQFLLEYISKNNTDLRSNIELRKELLLSYDKTINDWEIFVNNDVVSAEDLKYINELFEDVVYKVAELPTDIMSFGQAMMQVEIKNGRTENQLPSKINTKILNQTAFQRDKNGYAKVYKENGLEDVKIIGRDILSPSDDYGYIYVQDNEQFTGGVLKVLLLASIYHQYNNNEWLNFNSKLKGIIAGQYDLEKLHTDLTMLQQYQEALFGKSNSNTNDVMEMFNNMLARIMDDVRNAGKNRVTVVPNSVEFKQFEVAGKQGFEAFKEYDFLCKQLYENSYLGQSGNALVSNASSYSGSGIKALQLNTQNKERTDRRTATKIMNQILSYYWNVWKGNSYKSQLRFRYGQASNEDLESNLKVLSAVSNLKLNVGVRMDVQEFCKKIGITYNKNYWADVDYVQIGENETPQVTETLKEIETTATAVL